MTASNVAYRLTIYSGRSTDPAETTVLTPISGAAHSDNFQISTIALSGYKAYMGLPRGRRTRIDPLSKNSDVGELSIPVLDVRVGALSDNLTRWMTAFLGTTNGRQRLAGLKAKVEESLDGGTTWSNYFTGRVSGVSLTGKLMYTITLRDLGADLDLPTFVGQPHASLTGSTGYAQAVSYLPPGLMKAFGAYPVRRPLRGTIASRVTVISETVSYLTAIVELDAESKGRVDNIILANLTEASGIPQFLVSTFTLSGRAAPFTDQVLAHIKRLDTSAEGDFLCGQVAFVPNTITTTQSQQVKVNRAVAVSVRELRRNSSTEADPPGFMALPPNGTSVEIHLKGNGTGASQTTIAIDDVHPVTLWQDILAGKFGYLYSAGDLKPSTAAIGDVRRALPYSSSAFANLSSDVTWPNGRFVINQKGRLHEWVKSNILQPYQLGYYVDDSGQVVPIDLRRPTSLPSITVTDADLVEGQSNLQWDYGSDVVSRVIAHFYEDFPQAINEIIAYQVNAGWMGAGFEVRRTVQLPTADTIVTSARHTVDVRDLTHFDLGENEITIDAQGFRAMPSETIQNRNRLSYLKDKLAELSANLQQPYRGGTVSIGLVCRRTSNTNNIQPGTDVVLDIDALPDPRTNLRGGARVCRCVERSPDGVKVMLRFVDHGANIAANAPTVAVPTLMSGSTKHGVDVGITPNAAGDAQEIHFAITSTATTSAPSESAAAWTMTKIRASTSTGTVSVEGLPGVGRFWPRARSLPSGLDRMEQPSSWVSAGTTGYIDMPGLTGPNTLAAATSMLSDRRAVLTWTNGTTDVITDVRLTTPSTADLELIDTVLPGQNRYELLGLLPGTCYQAGVRHHDGLGGYSTEATLIFTSGSTALTAPDFGGISVVLGSA